jgi:hypothetical protein
VTHWLRLYAASGEREYRDVPVISTVAPGTVLAIWMSEERPSVAEEPHVQAELDRSGALYMLCQSVIVPDGEHGYVLCDPLDPSIMKITDACFEAARTRGWTLPPGGIDVSDLHFLEPARLATLMAVHEHEQRGGEPDGA